MLRQMRRTIARRSMAAKGSLAISLGASTVLLTTGLASAGTHNPAPGTSSTSSGASGSGGSPSSGSASAGSTPFTVEPDGWIDFTHTRQSAPPLTDSNVVTVSGSIDANGNCQVSNPTANVPLGVNVYESEVAFNPRLCEAKYLEGEISDGTAQTLGASPQPQQAPAAGAAPAQAPVFGQAAPRMVLPPPCTTCTWSAYQKDAYLDPLDITITSLANNLTWTMTSNNEEVLSQAGNLVGYRFAYDGWSGYGPEQNDYKNAAYTQAIQTGYYYSQNTDFEHIMEAIFGPAVIAVCGGGSPAVFVQDEQINGYWGGFFTGSSDSNTGGCSDLVHRDAESGWGSTS